MLELLDHAFPAPVEIVQKGAAAAFDRFRNASRAAVHRLQKRPTLLL
jgi:hypothetical protein